MMKVQFLRPHENKQVGWVCEVPDGVGANLVKNGIAQEVPKNTPSRKNIALYDGGCNPSASKLEKDKSGHVS